MGDIEAVRAAELTLDTTIDKMNLKDDVKNEVFDSASNLSQKPSSVNAESHQEEYSSVQ